MFKNLGVVEVGGIRAIDADNSSIASTHRKRFHKVALFLITERTLLKGVTKALVAEYIGAVGDQNKVVRVCAEKECLGELAIAFDPLFARHMTGAQVSRDEMSFEGKSHLLAYARDVSCLQVMAEIGSD